MGLRAVLSEAMLDISDIHPDRLAQYAVCVRWKPHFLVEVGPEQRYGSPEQQSFERAAAVGHTHSVAETFVRQRLSSLLADADSCRLYHPRTMYSLGGRLWWDHRSGVADFERKLAAYARRERSVTHVRLDYPPLRDDVDFWWYALRHRTVMLGLPHAALWSSHFLDGARGPQFWSINLLSRLVPRSAMDLAWRESSSGTSVFVCPRADSHGFGVELVASPDVAIQLIEHIITRQPPTEDDLAWVDQRTTRIVDPVFGYGTSPWFLDHVLTLDEPEPKLSLVMGRIGELLESRGDVLQALAAAECVAMMENRPAPGLAPRMVERVRSWNTRQDPLALATIKGALRAVDLIIERSPVHHRLWREPGAVRAWLEELAGLKARLQQAIVARNVRLTAPNATRLPTTRKPAEALRSPTRFRQMRFYALPSDAAALMDLMQLQTNARLIVSVDGDPHQLEPSELTSVVPAEFEDRGIGNNYPEYGRGIVVRVWWPDVCPAPDRVEQLAISSRRREMPGWGIAELHFCGASDRRLIISSFTYPTGAELRLPRYAGPGPWREVDWVGLRRKVRDVRALLGGALAGGWAKTREPVPVLHDAAAKARAGWTLADRNGYVGIDLPFVQSRGRV